MAGSSQQMIYIFLFVTKRTLTSAQGGDLSGSAFQLTWYLLHVCREQGAALTVSQNNDYMTEQLKNVPPPASTLIPLFSVNFLRLCYSTHLLFVFSGKHTFLITWGSQDQVTSPLKAWSTDLVFADQFFCLSQFLQQGTTTNTKASCSAALLNGLTFFVCSGSWWIFLSFQNECTCDNWCLTRFLWAGYSVSGTTLNTAWQGVSEEQLDCQIKHAGVN